MTYLNLTPNFKYFTYLCCQVRYIFSIYTPTRARSVHENHQHDQYWNPNTQKKDI